MANITIEGNIATDIELKFGQSGTAWATFMVMQSKNEKQADGSWKNSEETPWNIKAFGQLAENLAESLEKGNGVIVIGNAFQEVWETKDGEKRSRIVVNAFNVGPSLKRHKVDIHKTSRVAPATIDPWSAPVAPLAVWDAPAPAVDPWGQPKIDDTPPF